MIVINRTGFIKVDNLSYIPLVKVKSEWFIFCTQQTANGKRVVFTPNELFNFIIYLNSCISFLYRKKVYDENNALMFIKNCIDHALTVEDIYKNKEYCLIVELLNKKNNIIKTDIKSTKVLRKVLIKGNIKRMYYTRMIFKKKKYRKKVTCPSGKFVLKIEDSYFTKKRNGMIYLASAENLNSRQIGFLKLFNTVAEADDYIFQNEKTFSLYDIQICKISSTKTNIYIVTPIDNS